jgi:hypothetical protein
MTKGFVDLFPADVHRTAIQFAEELGPVVNLRILNQVQSGGTGHLLSVLINPCNCHIHHALHAAGLQTNTSKCCHSPTVHE